MRGCRGHLMTFTMRRYPVQLIDVIELANGSRVTVRPVLPQDAELQSAFFHALSDEDRYFRFMTRFGKLPEGLAERFADIDYRGHMALIAEIFIGDVQTMIGEARYIVDACDPSACECAIAVADNWQRMGLARALLARLLSHAAASGIRRMVGDTICSNTAMIELARKTGFSVERNPKDKELWRLEKSLTAFDHHKKCVPPPARAPCDSGMLLSKDQTRAGAG
jgi:acetyltransferase